jgi:hypothetical protein
VEEVNEKLNAELLLVSTVILLFSVEESETSQISVFFLSIKYLLEIQIFGKP